MQELVVEETLGTGNWGLNVLHWLKRSSPTAVIRFEKLIREPELEVAQALEALTIKPQRQANADPPMFSELNKVDGEFFRRGAVGSYRNEMPQEIQESFWKQSHHAEAMTLLGYR
jgi:Sulfotransferase domain